MVASIKLDFAPALTRPRMRRVVAVESTQTDQAFEDAWSAVRDGIRACRRCSDALEGFSNEERLSVLKFLVEWPKRRKALTSVGSECHQILMQSTAWAETTNSDAFRDFLQSQVPDDASELLSTATERLKTGQVAGRNSAVARIPEEITSSIQGQLREAIDRMKSFDFTFPRDFQSSKLDEATEAFELCHKAATSIFKLQERKKHPAEATEGILCIFDPQWVDVLKFLISTYRCDFRQCLSLRVQFVVSALQSSSAGFRQAVEAQCPPWLGCKGLEKTEVQVPEEFKLQEVEQDFEFAFDLQSKDFQRHLNAKSTMHKSPLRRLFA